MPLFLSSFGNALHYGESANGECGSQYEPDDQDLRQTVGVGPYQLPHVKQPYIVEYAVEKNVVEVGDQIGKGKILVAPHYVAMLSDAEPYE